jgi:hypothetical protein
MPSIHPGKIGVVTCKRCSILDELGIRVQRLSQKMSMKRCVAPYMEHHCYVTRLSHGSAFFDAIMVGRGRRERMPLHDVMRSLQGMWNFMFHKDRPCFFILCFIVLMSLSHIVLLVDSVCMLNRLYHCQPHSSWFGFAKKIISLVVLMLWLKWRTMFIMLGFQWTCLFF